VGVDVGMPIGEYGKKTDRSERLQEEREESGMMGMLPNPIRELQDSLDRRTTTLIIGLFLFGIAVGAMDACQKDRIEALEQRIEALEQKEEVKTNDR
jgi:hypothetical protein